MPDVNEHVKTFNVNSLYDENDPILNAEFKQLLKQHVDLDDAELIQHVRKFRDEAWKVWNYPCIGSYLFMEIGITSHPKYREALYRVRTGQKLLDVGSALGQDLRKLAYDGAPSTNLHGCDLHSDFWDIGYELFDDRETFRPGYTAGNFLAEDETTNLKPSTFDMIHAADFIHAFGWDDQVKILTRMIKLLKKRPGSMIFGRHIAVKEPIVMSMRGQYLHTGDSFMKLIDEVENRTGMALSRSVEVFSHQLDQRKKTAWDRRMRFSIALSEDNFPKKRMSKL